LTFRALPSDGVSLGLIQAKNTVRKTRSAMMATKTKPILLSTTAPLLSTARSMKATTRRNVELTRMATVFFVKNKKPQVKKAEEKKKIVKPFGKTGKTREVVRPRTPRFYPTERVVKPLPSRKSHHLPPRVRSNITPGTILIVLSGRFRGRRVVFLKALTSGLLLVTGPYKVNGVPLRRINQAYVIATNTKIDLSTLKIDDKFNDNYFKRPEKEKKKKTEADFFATETAKKQIDKHRIEDQKAFDTPLLALVKKTPQLKDYLQSRFSLQNGQYPHQMIF